MTADEKQLEEYFSKFGKIEDILINRSCETGGCRGCAFVLFTDEEVATRLINDPNRHKIGPHFVEVKCCHRKGSKAERNAVRKEFVQASKKVTEKAPQKQAQSTLNPSISLFSQKINNYQNQYAHQGFLGYNHTSTGLTVLTVKSQEFVPPPPCGHCHTHEHEHNAPTPAPVLAVVPAEDNQYNPEINNESPLQMFAIQQNNDDGNDSSDLITNKRSSKISEILTQSRKIETNHLVKNLKLRKPLDQVNNLFAKSIAKLKDKDNAIHQNFSLF